MNWYQEIAKAAGVTKEQLVATLDEEAAGIMSLARSGVLPIAEMFSRMEDLASMREQIESYFGDSE